MTSKALVLGLYINGYSIIRELAKDPSIKIAGLDYDRTSIGLASKYLYERYVVDYNNKDDVLLNFLINYGKKQDEKTVIYPTHDFYTKFLAKYYNELQDYYYIPINPGTIPIVISKMNQYSMCEQIDIPYPKTIFINSQEEFGKSIIEMKKMLFPVLVKPFSRAQNPAGFDFRVIKINDYSEFEQSIPILKNYINHGILISEIVPGEPDNIWAYTGYFDEKSEVIAGWTGRKLTQRPYYFGVFSSATCEINPIVEEQGIRLLKAFNFIGVGEPEFKFDHRDSKYKLMEINPRYMMWHIAGMQGGVNLPLIQYYHLTGKRNKLIKIQKKQNRKISHLVFMESELLNIIDHKPKSKYIKNSIKSFMLKNKIWAIANCNDPLPSIKNSFKFNLIKPIAGFFLRKFRILK